MTTSQSQLIEVLKEQISSVEERAPGYRAKVAETLGRIVGHEQKNRIRRIDIRQEVKKECVALGTFLADGSPAEPSGERTSEDHEQ